LPRRAKNHPLTPFPRIPPPSTRRKARFLAARPDFSAQRLPLPREKPHICDRISSRNGLCFSYTQHLLADPVPLKRAPRDVRLEALKNMPEFLAYLAKTVEKTVKELESTTQSFTAKKAK
jgi:hypothetical protein